MIVTQFYGSSLSFPRSISFVLQNTLTEAKRYFTDPQIPTIEKPTVPRNIPIGDGRPVTGNVGDNFTALPNTTITITCPSSGIPPPKIMWYKNGQPVSIKGRISIDDSGSLTVAHTKHLDSGRFTCSVTNVAGEDSVTSVVKVVGKW